MDLNKIKKIYIIGIEGAGTSALARMFKAMHKDVSGSDDGDHFYNDMLKSQRIAVFHKFNADNLPMDVDLIIYSIAFQPDKNPEVAEAFRSKIKTITYGEALGLLFNHKYGVAVCGSHGKTTAAAWLSFILNKTEIKPNMIVGAKVPQFNGNSLVGNSDYFIIEADEYGNKLQYLLPKAVLLNNIDYDHPDFFPTQEDYLDVFIEFIKKIPKKGFLIANFDDSLIRKIANVNCKGKVISYAIDEDADYVAYDIKFNNGKQYFKVRMGVNGSGELGDFCIQLSGRHNISNALAVIAACVELGVELVDIRKYLEEFTGTARRMQKMGEFNGAIIIDDYAHHPTEIKATLAGVRELYHKNKLIVVFHPHTFSRTKALLDNFAGSFGDADEVIVLDIYGSAREKQGGVHSRDLVNKIQNSKFKVQSQKILYIPTLKECEEYLRKNIERGDVVLLMGAGDVFRIGESLVKS